MKMPKAWFTVKEAAQQLECTEDEVLHQIQAGQLYPSILLPKTNCRLLRAGGGVVEWPFYGPVTPLEPSAIFRSQVLGSDWKHDLELKDELTRNFYEGLPDFSSKERSYFYPIEPVQIGINNIIIAPEELERFRAACCKSPCNKPETNDNQQKNECQLDPLEAIVGWKAIAEAIGKSVDYAPTYCKHNGIRVEHDKAGKPWTTLEEIAHSRTAK